MKKTISGFFFLLSGLIYEDSYAQEWGLCQYDDVQISSSVGNWIERFDGLDPDPSFFDAENSGVGNLIDGQTGNKQSDFWFNHSSLATVESPALLTLKLSNVKEISAIVLNNNNTKATSADYSLKYSPDAADHLDYSHVTLWQGLVADDAIGKISGGQEIRIDLPSPVLARYVQVALITNDKIIALNEITLSGSTGCEEDVESGMVGVGSGMLNERSKAGSHQPAVGGQQSGISKEGLFVVFGVIVFTVLVGLLYRRRK